MNSKRSRRPLIIRVTIPELEYSKRFECDAGTALEAIGSMYDEISRDAGLIDLSASGVDAHRERYCKPDGMAGHRSRFRLDCMRKDGRTSDGYMIVEGLPAPENIDAKRGPRRSLPRRAAVPNSITP